MGLGQYNGIEECCGPHTASEVLLILIIVEYVPRGLILLIGIGKGVSAVHMAFLYCLLAEL